MSVCYQLPTRISCTICWAIHSDSGGPSDCGWCTVIGCGRASINADSLPHAFGVIPAALIFGEPINLIVPTGLGIIVISIGFYRLK